MIAWIARHDVDGRPGLELETCCSVDVAVNEAGVVAVAVVVMLSPASRENGACAVLLSRPRASGALPARRGKDL